MTELYKPYIVMHLILLDLDNYVRAVRNWSNIRLRCASGGLATPAIEHLVTFRRFPTQCFY